MAWSICAPRERGERFVATTTNYLQDSLQARAVRANTALLDQQPEEAGALAGHPSIDQITSETASALIHLMTPVSTSAT